MTQFSSKSPSISRSSASAASSACITTTTTLTRLEMQTHSKAPSKDTYLGKTDGYLYAPQHPTRCYDCRTQVVSRVERRGPWLYTQAYSTRAIIFAAVQFPTSALERRHWPLSKWHSKVAWLPPLNQESEQQWHSLYRALL